MNGRMPSSRPLWMTCGRRPGGSSGTRMHAAVVVTIRLFVMFRQLGSVARYGLFARRRVAAEDRSLEPKEPERP